MKKNMIAVFMTTLLVLLSFAANAGPARDRAQAVMDGAQGDIVSQGRGLEVLDAFIAADRFKAHIPLVMVDDMAVPKTVWNLEEKSQFFLDRMRDFARDIRNRHKTGLKRLELQGDQDAIENQVAGVVVSDLGDL